MNTPEPTIQPSLSDLAAQLADARAAEADAKERRIQIEEAIVAQIETPEKGTVSMGTDNGLKISIKTDIGYSADLDEIIRIDSDLVKHTEKYELDTKRYEALRKSDPGLFARVSEHVTTKPRKPAVTLKVV